MSTLRKEADYAGENPLTSAVHSAAGQASDQAQNQIGHHPYAATASPQSAHESKTSRGFHLEASWLLPLSLIILLAVLVMLPASLAWGARMSLFAFGSAIVLWTTTRMNAAYVAIVSVLFTVITGAVEQEILFKSLASDIIWLMIGSFIMGGALQVTGLAHKLTNAIVQRARTVTNVFWLLTLVIQALAFFIPSTSGRAAVVLPVYQAISRAIGSKDVTRALAILMPTIILVSTISTLIGAGSHLIAVDLLQQFNGKSISFLQWMLWGMPFGIVASAISCQVVIRLFLRKEDEQRPIPYETVSVQFTRNEKYTFGLFGIIITLWLTESWHGIEIATVTMLGAILLTLPHIGVMKWKDGLKSVSWNLILFVGAALALGSALVESGAAKWIMDSIFAFAQNIQLQSSWLILLFIVLFSLTSHIYITSHTTRAIIMIPSLLYLASSLQVNETAVLFISTVGMNYCLTFPVSSKAILLFQEGEQSAFEPKDLLRLSAYLGVIHFVLIIAFYYGYWQWAGLAF
ncbi:SLC13 family permease [Paenibacillus sp. 481]|uniref:SLC13 family permease n=1 Tax=Paenibacillus sp. 481 TaxID=2835869 RepID=UPI0022B4E930|nr:SLC13 family permease [Paenibacillus sp. 481]UHA73805.1 SLC13 family permease [Paenibacillus sp. 481]